MLTPLSHGVSSWLSGSLDRVSYIKRPAYITGFRTSGTPLSQTDYAPKNIQVNADENWEISQFIVPYCLKHYD